MTFTPFAALLALLCSLLGAAVSYLWGQRRLTRLTGEKVRLEALLEAERLTAAEREAAYRNARDSLGETFNSMASEALKHNTTEFLKLAQENLKQFHVHAEGELAQREKAVENLVRPVREALEKTERQIRLMENQRQEAYGSLTRHLESIAESHRQLQTETRNLTQALRRPEVRGQWGEMTLRRLAELAGMVEHCDFYEQENVTTAEGRMRPDMIVRLPDRREIVVDVKTSLDAYLNATEAADDEARAKELLRHARNVRQRVKELADKAYWDQFRDAPDFVVLFIPGEQFLASALETDRDLLEFALTKKVILATPTSFVALLRAVAYGWRQEALAENAEQIRRLGEDLYGRLVKFADHLARLGRSLDSSVNQFNKAVGSFDARVLPSARRFTEMGISGDKEPERPQQVEKAVRSIVSEQEQ